MRGSFYAFTTINYAARGGIAATRFVDPSESKSPADAERVLRRAALSLTRVINGPLSLIIDGRGMYERISGDPLITTANLIS